jgi:hypothetical protein
MMLLGLLLWALVSAPAGGADVDEGWQVNQNSRPKLNVMMTCLGGCPVVRLVSQESRGFVCSASYETYMLPGFLDVQMVKPLFFLGRTEVSPMRVFRCLRMRLCVQRRCVDVIPTWMLERSVGAQFAAVI